MSAYTVHSSKTGDQVANISADSEYIESLSGASAEGHFRAGECAEIVAAGVAPDMSVYCLES